MRAFARIRFSAKLRATTLLGLALLICASLTRADVTVRYKNEVKMGAGAPPALTQQTSGVMQSVVPASTVIQIKGTKGYTNSRSLISLIDFQKQVITVIDPEHKQFATVYMKDYADQVLSVLPGMPSMPAEAQKALDSMKTSFTSEKTGKTDTVLGIQVEETQLTLTVDMPIPAGAAAATEANPATPAPKLIKMVLHIWTALPSEVGRVAALHEFSTVYGDPDANAVLNPDAIFSKAFGSLPGMGKGFGEMMGAVEQKKAIMLRTNVEMYMPFLATAFQAPNAAGQSQSFDPAAPVLEMKTEVEEISAAPVDDSVFEVPRDCQSVSVPDFFRALLPAAGQSPAQAAAQPQPGTDTAQ